MGESTPVILKCQINTLRSVAAGRIGGLPITIYGLLEVHAFVQRTPKESRRFLEI